MRDSTLRTVEFTSREQAFQGNNYRGQPLHHIHMGGRSAGLELERETHKNEWVQKICTINILRPLQFALNIVIIIFYNAHYLSKTCFLFLKNKVILKNHAIHSAAQCKK